MTSGDRDNGVFDKLDVLFSRLRDIRVSIELLRKDGTPEEYDNAWMDHRAVIGAIFQTLYGWRYGC